jgi:EF-hand domain-containing family member B
LFSSITSCSHDYFSVFLLFLYNSLLSTRSSLSTFLFLFVNYYLKTMSTRRIRDNAPWMETAGISTFKGDQFGTAIIQQQGEADRAVTPDKLKQFRRSHLAPLGKGATRTSLMNPVPEDVRFGIVGKKEDSAASCLAQSASLGMAATANEAAERIYKSHKAEPLGRSAQSQTHLPGQCKSSTFAFGISTQKKEGDDAKTAIASFGVGARAEETAIDEAHRPIGKAKARNYDWANAGIDPNAKRFGKLSSANKDGENLTMNHAVQGDPRSKQTVLLPRSVAESHAISSEQLGKPKNLGFGDRTQGKDFAYCTRQKFDEYGMKSLLSGGGFGNDNDPTLGRSISKINSLRNGRSTIQDQPDQQKTFGAPTIRYDLPRPANKRITNAKNYGDDASAAALLYPTSFTANGLSDELFSRNLTLQEFQDLNSRTDLGLTGDQVSHVFVHSQKQKQTTDSDVVDLATFRVSLEALGF